MSTLAAFGDWMVDQGYSRITRTNRLQRMVQADAWLRKRFHRTLIRANTDHLQAFLRSYDHAKTRNGYRSDFICFFRFAIETGRRAACPATPIKRWKEPRYLPRPATLAEARQLYRAAQTLSLRHLAIVSLLLYAGPRRAEVAGLRWSDVDFARGRIRLFGKGDRERTVPMASDLAAVLSVWRIAAPPSEWVFASTRKDHLRPGSIWRLMKEAAAAAGLPHSTHVLRHTFATILLDKGSNVREVQELLGHASLASTQIYTGVSVNRLEEAVSRLDFLGNGKEKLTREQLDSSPGTDGDSGLSE